MTRWSLSPLAILTCLPINASAQVDNYRPYHWLSAKECGAKHLEWLSPADLDERIEGFDETLTENTKANLDKASDEKTACANLSMGCGFR